MQDTPDAVWLPEVARRGWVALSRNKRIRYTPLEIDAVMISGARLFILIGPSGPAEQAEMVQLGLPRIREFLATQPAPFIAKLRRPAEVVLWLDRGTWLAGRSGGG